jgi:hypothetical protein
VAILCWDNSLDGLTILMILMMDPTDPTDPSAEVLTSAGRLYSYYIYRSHARKRAGMQFNLFHAAHILSLFYL